MAITRLVEETKSIDVTITVSAKLRPYFTKWYQAKKLKDETPSDFALRILKAAAIHDYVSETAQVEVQAIERTKDEAIKELQDDITILNREV